MTDELRQLLAAVDLLPAGVTDIEHLGDWIYTNCYIKHFDDPQRTTPSSDLTARLSTGNRSVDRMHEGWIAAQMLDDGQLLAHRNGILRTFVPGEFLVPGRGNGSFPEKGDAVVVSGQRESLRVQKGMYFVFGETLDDGEDSESLLRFYWNVRAENAARLIEEIATVCNLFELPFRFKCPRDAADYPRRDAGVLYVAGRHRDIALRVVARIHAQLPDGCLDPSVPLFARELAPGLGFAEEPGGGLSFGQHRCRLLAEALLNPTSKPFEREGLTLERPWLNAGSQDVNWLASAPGPRSCAGGFLETAARIGARLCRNAIWHAGLCNWTSDEIVRHAALGPNLYAGSSGIALFLARLERATGESIFGETARGAMRFASSSLALGSGLYDGETGVLLAAAEVFAERVDEARLLELAATSKHYDVMSGKAGVIAALLQVWRKSKSPTLLDQAIRSGDWLISNADRDTSGMSWKTKDVERNLTGFSHGAAGIGWILNEIYACCGDRRFADAAADAFRYERACFSVEEQNWPDFREEQVEYPLMWCHGAPGIVLSRLRAPADPDIREDLRIAVETARCAKIESWCLCHGRCGNAEILWLAGLRDEATSTGEEGIERYDRQRLPWPCALEEHGPEVPGLMLGLAGIGHFYLRLHVGEELPSPLLWI